MHLYLKGMNLEGVLYPTYYIVYPLMMISQPVVSQEFERSSEESLRELQRKPDVLVCER